MTPDGRSPFHPGGGSSVRRTLDGPDADALHARATIIGDGLLSVQLLNTTKNAIPCKLQIAGRCAEITVPANAVQTVRVALSM